ncbi:hypothetical protein [Falsirhodobacter sp. 1013]|uniref:hypothetical protein n=1 Tax=Falsirhodobacter sp. 1013 TaxID=3417566 RepID=UPI003EC0FBD0
MSKDIDQRAQRHDPASQKTRFPDEPTPKNMKQPASVANEGGDSVLSPQPSGKYNTRDDGHSETADDLPLQNIKKHTKDEE